MWRGMRRRLYTDSHDSRQFPTLQFKICPPFGEFTSSYCEKPLSETERVRWYGEHVHAECYEALLTDAVAIIVTEQPTQDSSKEIVSEVS